MATLLSFALCAALFYVMVRFGCGSHMCGHHTHGHPDARAQAK